MQIQPKFRCAMGCALLVGFVAVAQAQAPSKYRYVTLEYQKPAPG